MQGIMANVVLVVTHTAINARGFSPSLCMQAAAELGHVEDLVAALSSPQCTRLHLTMPPLRSRLRPPPKRTFRVWRATPAGCTVHSGAVELPERSVLLLAGRGAHFHGTTFKGPLLRRCSPPYSCTGLYGNTHLCTFPVLIRNRCAMALPPM